MPDLPNEAVEALKEFYGGDPEDCYGSQFRDALKEPARIICEQRDEELRERLEGVVKRLARIRDLDEQTSDGALGSLARRALDDIDSIFEEAD
jgi:hypothetical protein